MKKLFLSIAVLAAGLVSCSQSDVIDGATVTGETTVVVSAAVPADLYGTRSGEGSEVNRCQMEIYLDGVLYGDRQAAEVTGGTAQFSARLISGKTYDFVFWADAAENDADVHYDTSDLSNVFIKDAAAYAGNDETRDAFFGKETVEVTAATAVKAELRRPFGQLNVKTTDMKEVLAANIADLVPTHVSIAFKSVPTGINLLTGELTEAAEAVAYAEKCAVIDAEGVLSMDYIFAPKGEEQYLADFTMSFVNAAGGEAAADYEFSNIPVQRNYRTNVSGNLLTKKADINVEVKPGFDGDIEIDNMWDGSVAEPEVDADSKTVTIKSAAELAGLAAVVNGGNTLSGYTVTLAEDIDLAGLDWTPIGGNGHTFNGTFDGGNHTVSNLNITGGDYLGLFGSTNGGKLQNLTINGVNINGGSRLGALAGNLWTSDAENITVKNAVFEGNHYIGGITGYSYGALVNCTVDGIDAVCTPAKPEGATSYDDGDKVGGIVGWFASDDITGCSVSNAELKGYRDIGGIAGYVGKDGVDPKIVGNKVFGATITADQQTNGYGQKASNAGEIIGRLGTVSVTYADNVYENVTLNYIGCASGVSVETTEAAQSAIKLGGEVIVAAQMDKIDLTATTPLRPVKITINEPVGELVLGTAVDNPEKTTIVVAKDVAYPAFSFVKGYDLKNLEIIGDPASSKACSGISIHGSGVVTADNIKIKGVRFDGAGVNFGFSATPQFTKNIVVEDCVGENLVQPMFYTSNNQNGSEVGNIVIRNNTATFIKNDVSKNTNALYICFITTGNVLIEGNTFIDAPYHGIMGDRNICDEFIVRGNTFTTPGQDGVKLDYPYNKVIIEDNTIAPIHYGIRFQRFDATYSPTISIKGNKIDMSKASYTFYYGMTITLGSSANSTLFISGNIKAGGNPSKWYNISGTPAEGSDIATPFVE